jgi:hypothetical protein
MHSYQSSIAFYCTYPTKDNNVCSVCKIRQVMRYGLKDINTRPKALAKMHPTVEVLNNMLQKHF